MKAPNKNFERMKTKRALEKSHTGQILHYAYNPKYKDVLPFWDRFPTIIVLNQNSRYVLGLNIHFVPTSVRKKIIQFLLKKNKYNIKNNRPIVASYDMFKSFLREINAVICIRKYIKSRMSHNCIIPSTYESYIDSVVHLPTKKIYGMSQEDIYRLLLQDKKKKTRNIRNTRRKTHKKKR